MALASNPNWGVRLRVAENRNTPSQVLVQLADDPEEWVRYYVNENPHTPPEVRQRLAAEPLPQSYVDFLED